jgi:hypothetical protein
MQTHNTFIKYNLLICHKILTQFTYKIIDKHLQLSRQKYSDFQILIISKFLNQILGRISNPTFST